VRFFIEWAQESHYPKAESHQENALSILRILPRIAHQLANARQFCALLETAAEKTRRISTNKCPKVAGNGAFFEGQEAPFLRAGPTSRDRNPSSCQSLRLQSLAPQKWRRPQKMAIERHFL
jgi:hypothetical protein